MSVLLAPFDLEAEQRGEWDAPSLFCCRGDRLVSSPARTIRLPLQAMPHKAPPHENAAPGRAGASRPVFIEKRKWRDEIRAGLLIAPCAEVRSGESVCPRLARVRLVPPPASLRGCQEVLGTSSRFKRETLVSEAAQRDARRTEPRSQHDSASIRASEAGVLETNVGARERGRTKSWSIIC